MIGRTVSHYQILEKLGEGGMGEVYRAQDTRLGRNVALKFLPQHLQQDDTAARRFLREAHSAAALDHPYICKIYEVGQTAGGHDFIVMEHVEGQTLREVLKKGPLPLRKALQVASEVAEALEEAHGRQIVHRDLKPSNIMLTRSGHAKVMDFGLAKRFAEDDAKEQDLTTLTREGSTPGTVAYMSPEQVKAQPVDPRSDIFSFGLVLYEMLTGVHPFRKASSMETAAAIQTEAPAPLARYVSQIPELAQHTVGKMLAKEPDRRYSTVHDVRINLEQLVEDSGKSAAEIGQAPGESTLEGNQLQPVAPGPEKKPASSTVWLGLAAVAVVLVLAVLLGNWNKISLFGPVVDAGSRSVAVLPLQNLSADPENEYFSDGITEDIIAQLSKIESLKVVSRTSVMRFKNSEKSLREIAGELGVATILEGSVRRADGQVRIVAQLIDARSDEHLWAETYDRELNEVFAIQSEVAEQIAAALQAELSPEEMELVAKRSTDNFEAYNLYLQGRHYWIQETTASIQKAVECFQQAINVDPNYALAYAGLADAYLGLDQWGATDTWREEAVQAARRAIELDASVPEAHIAMGLIRYRLDQDWPGAEAEFQQALKLNPRHANVHREYGLFLLRFGRVDEALVHLKRALEMDPLSLQTNENLGRVYLVLGAFDEVIRIGRKVLELGPSSFMGPLKLGNGYEGLAEYERADHWFNRALEIEPNHDELFRPLARSLLWQGKVDQAAEISERGLALRRGAFNLSVAGLILLRQGNHEKARAYLEKALQLFPPAHAVPFLMRSSTLLGYMLWEKERALSEKMLSQSLVSDGRERIVAGTESGHPGWIYDISMVYAIRGEKEDAYRWLQRAIDRGWRYYDIASKEPIWADFHDEERFQQMMADVKAKVDEMRRRVRDMEKEWESR